MTVYVLDYNHDDDLNQTSTLGIYCLLDAAKEAALTEHTEYAGDEAIELVWEKPDGWTSEAYEASRDEDYEMWFRIVVHEVEA